MDLVWIHRTAHLSKSRGRRELSKTEQDRREARKGEACSVQRGTLNLTAHWKDRSITECEVEHTQPHSSLGRKGAV